MDEIGSNGDGEKGLEWGCVLKVEPTRFADGLDVRYERKKSGVTPRPKRLEGWRSYLVKWRTLR